MVVVVGRCRQNRMDKYHFLIRLGVKTPESTAFIPVACSICKQRCGKLCRRSPKKKKPVTPSQRPQSAAATTPLLASPTPYPAGPPTWARPPFRGRGVPPGPYRFPPPRPGTPGPRFPPPRGIPPGFPRPPRPPATPLTRPPSKTK